MGLLFNKVFPHCFITVVAMFTYSKLAVPGNLP